MALSAGHSPAWSLRLVHSAVPGRARFRLRALGSSNGRARHAVAALRSLPGIRRVRANPATGTLLIDYAAGEPIETLQERVSISLSRAFDHPVGAGASGNAPGAGIIRRLDALLRPAPPGPASRQSAQAWHAMDRASLIERLAADGADGLGIAEVRERLERYGPNLLPELLPPSALEMWIRQFTTLPVGMLAASGGIALATGGILDAVAIGAVVLTNAVIGFGTEQKSEQTIAALASGSPGEARVRRAGAERQIPIAELVPGDLLPLLPGTYVPADARVLKSHRLSVDESALTGESMPVTKRAKTVLPADTPLADRNNMVFCGTTITGGSGLAMAVATGPHSELGRIQTAAGRVEAPETPMQRQLGHMGGQLALLSAAACAGVFAVGLVRGRGALEMIKSSISLGVAAVPEGLPTVATTTLALGIREMSRRNVAVRQLGAVEALGAVQIFCLDKTGTLTENRMQVTSVHVDRGRHEIGAGKWVRDGQLVDPVGSATRRRLLEMLVLCNESRPGDDGGFVGTPTENALLELSAAAGIDIEGVRRRFPLLNIRYRSEQRHYMVTVHRAGKRRLAAVKGSPAEILPLCRWIMINGRRRVLTEAMRGELTRENERWAGEALRVLAVATARFDADARWRDAGLVWLGLVGMTDPLREGMAEVIADMHQAGIRTVMITGDQSATAYAVGKALNLSEGKPLKVLDSVQLDRLPEELRQALAQETHVFARVSPSHKLEIVQALQRSGRVVAMTGDGINDGPALKAADVGVAMGGAGQDVARSLSDVVLEDDRLATMLSAISQGRTIYANIRKSLHFLLSTNFSEIEVMLTAIALGLAPPLNPLQLLWVNLITDVFPGLALAMEAPEPGVMERAPRASDEPIIRREDLKQMALESGFITTGTLATYGWGLLRYGSGASASGLAFNTLTIAQLLHAYLCRSQDAGLMQAGRPRNRHLDTAVGLSLAAQAGTMILPPVRRLLGAGPVGLFDLPMIAAGAIGPLILNDWRKRRRLAASAARDSAAHGARDDEEE
ncbi:MAG: HAD-IC family P-type ATPase [Gammaproteobacteria bacterium]|jgi:Ca2+-transporting ATPase